MVASGEPAKHHKQRGRGALARCTRLPRSLETKLPHTPLSFNFLWSRQRTRGSRGSRPRSRRRSCKVEAVRRRVKRRQFDAGGDQTSCRRSRDAAKNMYTTRRATIGHFLHHSGHGACDDGTRSGRLHRIDLKSSKRVLSSGDYFYFCNRKNKLVGGRIHIFWIDYDPKSILKFLVF